MKLIPPWGRKTILDPLVARETKSVHADFTKQLNARKDRNPMGVCIPLINPART